MYELVPFVYISASILRSAIQYDIPRSPPAFRLQFPSVEVPQHACIRTYKHESIMLRAEQRSTDASLAKPSQTERF